MTKQLMGSLFIVAAPSGGGKTSLVKRVISELPDLVVSISHTTREQRPGETDGLHYFFTDEAQFVDMIHADFFVEYARVFDHYYGTSRTEITERLRQGLDVILDIDWQGAAQIKQLFPEAVSVFILPPSLLALKKRLM